jgi:nitrogen fixation protein FixH
MTSLLPNWGVRIALVYGLFASGTAAFVVFAMSQRVDLVAPDYYARSLTHDRRLEAMARVSALGPAFRIGASADGRVVDLAIPEDAAAGLVGTILFYRPADSAADRSRALALEADGRQRLRLDDLAPGPWRLQVQWTAGGREFYHEHPFVIR